MSPNNGASKAVLKLAKSPDSLFVNQLNHSKLTNLKSNNSSKDYQNNLNGCVGLVNKKINALFSNNVANYSKLKESTLGPKKTFKAKDDSLLKKPNKFLIHRLNAEIYKSTKEFDLDFDSIKNIAFNKC